MGKKHDELDALADEVVALVEMVDVLHDISCGCVLGMSMASRLFRNRKKGKIRKPKMKLFS